MHLSSYKLYILDRYRRNEEGLAFKYICILDCVRSITELATARTVLTCPMLTINRQVLLLLPDKLQVINNTALSRQCKSFSKWSLLCRSKCVCNMIFVWNFSLFTFLLVWLLCKWSKVGCISKGNFKETEILLLEITARWLTAHRKNVQVK